MNEIIQAAKSAFIDIMTVYFTGHDPNKLLSLFSSDIFSIGPGSADLAHNKHEMQALFAIRAMQNPGTCEINFKRVFAKSLNDDDVLLLALMDLSAKGATPYTLRHTAIMHNADGVFTITSLHSSVAYPLCYPKHQQTSSVPCPNRALDVQNKVKVCLETLNLIPAGVVIVDYNKNVIFINDYTSSITDRTQQECLGKPCKSCFEQNVYDALMVSSEKALCRDSSGTYLSHNGRYYCLFSSALVDVPGINGGFISLISDVSQMSALNRSISEREQRLRIAFDMTRDIVFDYDIESGTEYHDQKSFQLYGLEGEIKNVPESLILSGHVLPEYANAFANAYKKLINGEKRSSCIAKVRLKTGAWAWNRITLCAIADKNGNTKRAVGLREDITEQREAEISYLREEQYRTAVLSEAMLVYDINLTRNEYLKSHEVRNVAFNPDRSATYQELIDFLAEDYIYRDDKTIFASTYGKVNLKNAYEHGTGEITLEYRRLNNDGEVIWVSNTLHLLTDPLSREVKGFMYVKNIDGQKKREISLKYRAERDLLTGLYNKETTRGYIQRTLEKSNGNEIHAFMMIDLDNFKAINDTLGHVFGDAVLSEFSKKIRDCFRSTDIVGRVGGDEFAVFMSDVDSVARVSKKAQVIYDMFHAAYTGENKTYKVSGSIGISLYPQDGVDFDSLYKKADLALYNAKRLGKDCFAFYKSAFDADDAQSTINTIDAGTKKVFSENVAEYVFRILHGATDLRLAVNSVLELVCSHFKLSRGYIFENSADGKTCSDTFEWCAKNIEPQIDNLQNLEYASINPYSSQFDENGTWHVKCVDSVSPPLRDFLLPQGITSMVQYAVYHDGAFKGFIGFDDCTGEKVFTDNEIDTLRSISAILGTFLLKSRLEAYYHKANDALKVILDSLDSYAYVIDDKGHELLAINNKTLQVAPNANIGDACYKTFWNRSEPCSHCPINTLDDNNKSTIEVYNDVLNIWSETTASNITLNDGRKCYLISCVDITKYKQ